MLTQMPRLDTILHGGRQELTKARGLGLLCHHAEFYSFSGGAVWVYVTSATIRSRFGVRGCEYGEFVAFGGLSSESIGWGRVQLGRMEYIIISSLGLIIWRLPCPQRMPCRIREVIMNIFCPISACYFQLMRVKIMISGCATLSTQSSYEEKG